LGGRGGGGGGSTTRARAARARAGLSTAGRAWGGANAPRPATGTPHARPMWPATAPLTCHRHAHRLRDFTGIVARARANGRSRYQWRPALQIGDARTAPRVGCVCDARPSDVDARLLKGSSLANRLHQPDTVRFVKPRAGGATASRQTSPSVSRFKRLGVGSFFPRPASLPPPTPTPAVKNEVRCAPRG
jgi:hypothetical protein